MRAMLALLIAFLPLAAKEPQITIEDTGSTNRGGVRVTFNQKGEATVFPRRGDPQPVRLDKTICKQFLRDVRALEPLSALPANHCMKSVSFGSSLFVELPGDRSPDLSCPFKDARLDDLKKQANEILQAAREAAGIRAKRMLPLPAAPK